MIVQMKKVSIVVLNKERKEALKQLKKVGVVHLRLCTQGGSRVRWPLWPEFFVDRKAEMRV